MSNRIEYFDVLRGLAIIGVVAIHSSTTGFQFEYHSFNFNFTVVWRNLLNFSVPLFLAISGYFLAKKKIESLDDYLAFIKKYIARVYIPFFIWSSAWFCLAVLIYGKPIIYEIMKLVSFQSSGPYYFIALIIQYYLLLPILSRLANIKGLAICIAISIIMTGIIFYLRYYNNIELPLIIYAGNFGTWIMFFVLGLYLAIGSKEQNTIPNKVLIAFILIFFMLSCIESYAIFFSFPQAGSMASAVRVFPFLYSFTLIIFLFKNANLIQSRILASIGKISFGIYLIHMFALVATTQFFSSFLPSFQTFSPIYQFSLILLVIVLCFLTISLFNSAFSTKTSRLIGFK